MNSIHNQNRLNSVIRLLCNIPIFWHNGEAKKLCSIVTFVFYVFALSRHCHHSFALTNINISNWVLRSSTSILFEKQVLFWIHLMTNSFFLFSLQLTFKFGMKKYFYILDKFVSKTQTCFGAHFFISKFFSKFSTT